MAVTPQQVLQEYLHGEDEQHFVSSTFVVWVRDNSHALRTMQLTTTASNGQVSELLGILSL
jgi:hypothetical protein